MWSLVTGASSGIGRQFAIQLARDYQCDVVLVSNQQEALETTAKEIAEQYHVETRAHYADLSQADAAEKVYAYCQQEGLQIDVLINDAGVFFFNPYMETEMPRIERMLLLHVVTVSKMTRLFGADMAQRHKGYILNMSSMSAWMAMPGIQTYNATKAFIYNLTKSLWYEMKPLGVHVTAMTPGTVDTGLFGLNDRLRKVAVRLGISMPPEKLVRHALKALWKGKKQCMPGLMNHLSTPLLKHTPDWLVFAIIRAVGKYQK